MVRSDDLLTTSDIARGVGIAESAVRAYNARGQMGRIWVHSSNICEGHRVVQELAAAGYPLQRSYAANLLRRSW